MGHVGVSKDIYENHLKYVFETILSAFTTVALIESHYFKRYNKSVELSEQYLIDCVPKGCRGAHYYNGLDFVEGNGIPSSSYKYMEKEGSCVLSLQKAPIKVSSFKYFESLSIEEMKRTISNFGPVGVGMDASAITFSAYQSGIFEDANCDNTKTNHAVLVVGYGN